MIIAKSPIIGIAAYAGAGKTLAAAMLKTSSFKVISFAAPIKDSLRAMGLTEDEINGRGKEFANDKLGGHSPRYAMQTLGTEWGRNLLHENLWVDIWRRKVLALPVGTPVVCDDVRFQNEVDVIHSLGGIVVRIVRDSALTSQSNHVSEQQGFFADVTIHNGGTTQQLMNRMTALANAVLSKLPIDIDGTIQMQEAAE